MDRPQSDQFRSRGQLEFGGIEKLPETPITPAAVEKLKTWGIPLQYITELRNFCAGFRYDLCREKVERLAESEVFIRDYPEWEVVDFPFFFGRKGRMDGECGDIANQFLMQAEFSGLLAQLNRQAKLTAGCRIVTCFCSGQSRTHFFDESSTHIWNQLAVVNQKEEIVDSILVDAAFQLLSSGEAESGYKLKSRMLNPSGMKDKSLRVTARIGSMKVDGDKWHATMPPSIILGVSDDRKYAYALTFFRVNVEISGKDRSPTTLLARISEKGQAAYFFIHPENEDLIMTYPEKIAVPEEELEEIDGILQACKKFRYTTDLNRYPIGIDSGYNVNWRTKQK